MTHNYHNQIRKRSDQAFGHYVNGRTDGSTYQTAFLIKNILKYIKII